MYDKINYGIELCFPSFYDALGLENNRNAYDDSIPYHHKDQQYKEPSHQSYQELRVHHVPGRGRTGET
jgi:hypothetical protein